MASHKKTGLPNDRAPIASRPAQDDQSGKDAVLQDDASSTQRAEPDAATSTAGTSQSSAPIKIPHPNRSSWYTGGSWRSKASPVAQVARESISVDRGVSSESSSQGDSTKARPPQSLSKGLKGSRKSIPLIAEETRVHATSDAADKSRPAKAKFPSEEKPKVAEPPVIEESKIPIKPEPTEPKDSPDSPEVAALETERENDAKNGEMSEARPSSWLSWWSRPDGYASDGDKMKLDKKADLDDESGKAATSAPPDHNTSKADQSEVTSTNGTESRFRSEMNSNAASARSWFGLWSSAQNQQATADESKVAATEQPTTADNTADTKSDAPAQPAPHTPQTKSDDGKSKPGEDRPKASGWAFWSTEKVGDGTANSGDTQKQVGQLAVADTPSQSHPEAAQYNEQRKDSKAESSKPTKRNSSLLRLKRGRPSTAKDVASENKSDAPSIESTPQTPVETPESSPAPAPGGKRALQVPPNHILPSIRETYPPAPSLSTLERLTQYVTQSLHLSSMTSQHPPKHPYLTSSPPKIKKAIAIGIHGFFPAPLIQRVIGQPTGTSIRFANSAASSIKQWCQDHQPDVKDVEIEKVALEGEGYIADRVATLWKLLLNWLSHLRQADFILVACHSQGVPVAVMLVAKLIQLGCLSSSARIGICAMAGINLGPFVEYKSRLFGGIALELFDFRESKSKVSVAYLDSLDICLRNGVRVTFVGSMDDQLVSLESSLHTPLTHPYVNRAVFIDGRLHTPNFLTHLIAFAIKLRNLGANDHGLIREVSAALAGSLVGGEGHSRLYDDPAVYSMAVEFAMESTNMDPPPLRAPTPPMSAAEEEKAREAETQRRGSISGYPNTTAAANSMRRGSLTSSFLGLPGIAPVVASYEAPGIAGPSEKNPYVLPWAVRGMLAEDCVKNDPKMQEEVKELVAEFEDWKPTSKVLRDVRWRLEGVRSML